MQHNQPTSQPGSGNNFSQYKKLVEIIFQKLPPQLQQEWMPKIDTVVNKLLQMSQFGQQVQSIVTNNSMTFEQKQQALQSNDMLSKNEASVLLNVLNLTNFTPGQKNQFSSFMGTSNDWDNTNIFSLMTQYLMYIPQYFMNATRELFSYFTGMNDSSGTDEFKQPIDLIYVALFVFASVPFFGVIADFLIIIRAMMEGKMFLALLTTYTVFISLFQYHFFDMGLIFKGFYGIDSFSQSNERRSRKKLGLPETGPLPESFSHTKPVSTQSYFAPHQQVFQNQFSQAAQQGQAGNLMQYFGHNQANPMSAPRNSGSSASSSFNLNTIGNDFKNALSILKDNSLENDVMPKELENLTEEEAQKLEDLFTMAAKEMKAGPSNSLNLSRKIQQQELKSNASLLKQMNLD